MAAGKRDLANHENQHEFPLGWSWMPWCDAACLRPVSTSPDTPSLRGVESYATPGGGNNLRVCENRTDLRWSKAQHGSIGDCETHWDDLTPCQLSGVSFFNLRCIFFFNFRRLTVEYFNYYASFALKYNLFICTDQFVIQLNSQSALQHLK